MFWCFLWQVLQPRTACRAVVRRVQAFCESDSRPIAENTSAYCQARVRLPLECVEAAFRQSGEAARRLCPDGVAGWSRPIKVVDGSCVRLADTSANRAVYSYPGCQRKGCGFPTMKLLGMFGLASGALMAVASDTWQTSEMRPLLRLLKELHPGDILLGDRALCSWFALARLPALGVDVVTRLNARRLLKPGHVRQIGPADWLGIWKRPELCPPYLSASEWDGLPAQITVRMIRSTLSRPGFRTQEVWLCTTLLDPLTYPAAEIARLYLRRWEMELCFRDLKTTMGMEELRCRSPDMVQKELLMFLTAHNLIRCLIAQAAAAHQAPRTRISFKGTVDAARCFHQAMRLARSAAKTRQLHARLLEILVRDLIPHRPGRAEPRAVKRRPKPYQRLTKPRHLYHETPHRAKPRSKEQAPCLS